VTAGWDSCAGGLEPMPRAGKICPEICPELRDFEVNSAHLGELRAPQMQAKDLQTGNF